MKQAFIFLSDCSNKIIPNVDKLYASIQRTAGVHLAVAWDAVRWWLKK